MSVITVDQVKEIYFLTNGERPEFGDGVVRVGNKTWLGGETESNAEILDRIIEDLNEYLGSETAVEQALDEIAVAQATRDEAELAFRRTPLDWARHDWEAFLRDADNTVQGGNDLLAGACTIMTYLVGGPRTDVEYAEGLSWFYDEALPCLLGEIGGLGDGTLSLSKMLVLNAIADLLAEVLSVEGEADLFGSGTVRFAPPDDDDWREDRDWTMTSPD